MKSFYGSRKTDTIATKIKLPNTNISSDEDLSDDNSPSIIYESTEWEETSASSSSESEIAPSTQFITKQPLTKKKRIENPIWKLGNLKKNKSEIDFTPAPNQETFENLLKDFANELSFFYFLFPVDILNDIVYQTILYSTQERPEKPISITLDDIEKFIACVLYMSVIKLPSTRDYWSSKLSVSCVSDLMGVNIFKEIKRFMHFNYNCVKNVDDKLHKLRPVIDNINERLRLVPIEECLAVDEQIIPFKGKSSLKQYNPKKPHKWGYKGFALSGVSGFSYNFEIFTGKSDNICAQDEPDMGACSNVVVRFARIIPNFWNYKLHIDNWFNSVPLQIFMYERG